jgi:short-subunit dehydrogenase
MRNLDKQSSLQEEVKNAGVSLEIKRLDVQEMSSIEQCITQIIQKEGRIDILINKAGAGFVRTTEQVTEKKFNGLWMLILWGWFVVQKLLFLI